MKPHRLTSIVEDTVSLTGDGVGSFSTGDVVPWASASVLSSRDDWSISVPSVSLPSSLSAVEAVGAGDKDEDEVSSASRFTG